MASNAEVKDLDLASVDDPEPCLQGALEEVGLAARTQSRPGSQQLVEPTDPLKYVAANDHVRGDTPIDARRGKLAVVDTALRLENSGVPYGIRTWGNADAPANDGGVRLSAENGFEPVQPIGGYTTVVVSARYRRCPRRQRSLDCVRRTPPA